MARQFATIDEYIRSFPEDVRLILEEVRRTIRTVAPGADETISYQIPTITLNGKTLIYFAAWKHHISLYPIPTEDVPFEQELAPYRAAKATARFPFRKPIPYEIIARLVALGIKQQVDSGE
ncbi:MAG: iron chaperone [Chloroflexota bacterium]